MEKQETETKAAKSAWTKELQNFRIKCRMLDRTKYHPLLALRPEGKSMVEQLEKIERRYAVEHDEEEVRIHSTINGLRKATRELKALVQENSAMPTDQKLSQLQRKTSEIETGLKQFKLQSRDRYEELAREEAELTKEIGMYTEKFEAIKQEVSETRRIKQNAKPRVRTGLEKPAAAGEKLKPGAVSSDVDPDEEEEKQIGGAKRVKMQLEKVEEQIADLGGVYCGWDRSDHDDFLKLRTKHKGKTRTIIFLNELQKLLPEQNAENVADHTSRYESYLKLCVERKDLLARYKELKKQEEKQEAAGEEEVDKENKEKPQTRAGPREDPAKQKEKIGEWKKQKEVQLREKTEKELAERKQKEEERSRKRELERAKQQRTLQEYKEKKAAEELAKMQQDAIKKSEKKKPKPEDVAKLQEREHETFMKKMEKVQSKKFAKIDRIEREERTKQKLQENYKHVASKLNSETAAAVSKKREKFDGKGKDALTFGGCVVYTQMRAVPSWRAGL